MYGVQAKGSEHIEHLLKRFKRVTESAGMLTEIKRRRAYEKPSAKARRERNAAIRKAHFTPTVRPKKSRH